MTNPTGACCHWITLDTQSSAYAEGIVQKHDAPQDAAVELEAWFRTQADSAHEFPPAGAVWRLILMDIGDLDRVSWLAIVLKLAERKGNAR